MEGYRVVGLPRTVGGASSGCAEALFERTTLKEFVTSEDSGYLFPTLYL